MGAIGAIGKTLFSELCKKNSSSMNKILPQSTKIKLLFEGGSKATKPLLKTLLSPELLKIKSNGIEKLKKIKEINLPSINHIFKLIPLEELSTKFPSESPKVLDFLRHIRIADKSRISRTLTLSEIQEIVGKKGLIKKLEEMLKYQDELLKKRNNMRFPGSSKGKIPRYIYHLTPAEKYESMLATGGIKPSAHTNIRGVYATDLDNLLTRWSSTSIQVDPLRRNNFLHLLLNYTRKGKDKIVCLRIPTAQLDKSRLLVRSQTRLYSCNSPETVFIDATRDVPPEKLMQRLISSMSSYADNALHPEFSVHIAKGAPAGTSTLFKQRKEPIEYIYRSAIPIEKAEKIGEVDMAEVFKSPAFDKTHPLKSFLKVLFQGTSEQKAVEFLNC